jgi:predicted transposase YdaD
MKESVIYQDILAEGLAEGIAEGLAQGQLRGGRAMVARLLAKKLGNLPIDMQTQIDNLSIEQIEALGEALLDFANLSDLSSWLDREQ